MKLHTEGLTEGKNLLAFSAGIDSSALFFLLLEHNIAFDIAIVDYGLRAQSKTEVAHAKALAKTYGLTCHTVTAPYFDNHFEAQARAFRYNFFEKLITKHHYTTLLTAHQLNDQLEWLLMRLCKGAGVAELVGLEPMSQREGYTLVRPLLGYTKAELLAYLQAHDHPYFVDESNHDTLYERNHFRKAFANPLIETYATGIRRSFDYLREDKRRLEKSYKTLVQEKELIIVKLHTPQAKAKAADVSLKRLGYLLSAAQRQEITNVQSLVIGGKWAVELQDDLLFIAPYVKADMPKGFKEACRVHKIPAKIRPYLYQEGIDIHTIFNL